MAEPSAEKFEAWQDILENFFLEDLELSPEFVKKFFVSNLVQRTLSHLVGQGKRRAIPIRATEAGGLVVAATATAFEDSQVDKATFTDDDADQITYATTVSRVDVTVWTNAVYFRLSPDGTRWGGWIERNADSEYSFDCSVSKLEIKNKDAGQNARYQLVGWY